MSRRDSAEGRWILVLVVFVLLACVSLAPDDWVERLPEAIDAAGKIYAEAWSWR